jgi:hypothetical protein
LRASKTAWQSIGAGVAVPAGHDMLAVRGAAPARRPRRLNFIVMPHNRHWHWLVFAWCVLIGCARNHSLEKKMPAQPEQKITALTEADQQRLGDHGG